MTDLTAALEPTSVGEEGTVRYNAQQLLRPGRRSAALWIAAILPSSAATDRLSGIAWRTRVAGAYGPSDPADLRV